MHLIYTSNLNVLGRMASLVGCTMRRHKPCLVSALAWFYEVGNGLLMACRRKRIAFNQIHGFLTRLKSLLIEAARQNPTEILELPVVAEKHNLTNYDAAYWLLRCDSVSPWPQPTPISGAPLPQQVSRWCLDR